MSFLKSAQKALTDGNTRGHPLYGYAEAGARPQQIKYLTPDGGRGAYTGGGIFGRRQPKIDFSNWSPIQQYLYRTKSLTNTVAKAMGIHMLKDQEAAWVAAQKANAAGRNQQTPEGVTILTGGIQQTPGISVGEQPMSSTPARLSENYSIAPGATSELKVEMPFSANVYNSNQRRSGWGSTFINL